MQDLVGNKTETKPLLVGKLNIEVEGSRKVIRRNHIYSMDGYLRSNLDAVIRNVKNDYDAFIVVAGREGFGKSTIAAQCALYCDETYNLDRCCFTAKQFIEAVNNAKRYQAIVFDETMGYLSSRGSMSKFNRALIKVMSEMRSKNLFIFLCIPNFFELDRYPAMHRSTGLIYTYRRGRFGSYDYNTKKNLYLFGKKYYSYKIPPNFWGSFTKYFPLDKIAYEKKKQQAIAEWDKEVKRKSSKDEEISELL